jgi:hypothetical protein
MEKREAEVLAAKNLQDMLETLEMRLKLPSGHVMKLRDSGSDYEYIVKLAVLCEAVTTQALVSILHNDALFEHFSNAGQAVRLNLCVKMGVLQESEAGPLRALATTRNQFAHRVENLEKSLAEYVDGLKGTQKMELVNRLLNLEGKESAKEKDDFSGLPKAIRTMLFDMALNPLLLLSWQDQAAERERERRKLEELTGGARPFALSDLFRSNPAQDAAGTPLALRAAEAVAKAELAKK